MDCDKGQGAATSHLGQVTHVGQLLALAVPLVCRDCGANPALVGGAGACQQVGESTDTEPASKEVDSTKCEVGGYCILECLYLLKPTPQSTDILSSSL